MPAPVLHLGAAVLCAHGGQAAPMAPFPRVTVSGQPVATIASPWAIAACGLAATSTPPCVSGQFVTGTLRVLAGGQPLATLAGSSTCVPTGTPMLPVSAQPRVLAS